MDVPTARSLLSLEREEERREHVEGCAGLAPREIERRGVGLANLRLHGVETGLYGRTMLTLKPAGGRPLPPTRLSPGAAVALRPVGGGAELVTHGTLTKLGGTSVVVAIEEMPETGLQEPLLLLLMHNEVTYRRIDKALSAIADGSVSTAASLVVSALLGGEGGRAAEALVPPQPPVPLPLHACRNQGLNEGQRAAVSFGLAASPVCLIHGPPGTGKTTAVVELILQATARGERVLACAASNVAVDNMAERLLASPRPPSLVRVGHPARLHPAVLSASLDARMSRSDAAAIVADVRDELVEARRKLLGERSKGTRARLRAEVKTLRGELTSRQIKAVKELLSGAQVVLATNTGAADRAFDALPPDHAFDLVVIDEAAQALEASCWVPLLRGRRAVLAGDHRQLPPVVKSAEAAAKGLGITLFERLLEQHPGLGVMLTEQYRMHAAICRWASDELYGGKLTAHSSVASHTLSGLPSVVESDVTVAPLMLIDTAGCDCEEDESLIAADSASATRIDGPKSFSTPPALSEVLSVSRSNAAEAEIVRAYVDELRSSGVSDSQIGVITPYNAQVELLRDLLWKGGGEDVAKAEDAPLDTGASGFVGGRAISSSEGSGKVASEGDRGGRLEIGTVDGFQGREKEVIIISLVRSNPKGDVGFLSEDRRMNVAVTRARRQVALIGDSSTASRHPFLRRLFDYLSAHGEVRTGFDYGAGPSISQSSARKGASGNADGKGGRPGHPRREDKEEAEVERSLRARLLAFLSDASVGRIQMGTELTSFERMIAHRLCEEMGIDHESTGEGRKRRLVLTKPGWEPPAATQLPSPKEVSPSPKDEVDGAVAMEASLEAGAEAGLESVGDDSYYEEAIEDARYGEADQPVKGDADLPRLEVESNSAGNCSTSNAATHSLADETPMEQMRASPELVEVVAIARRDPSRLQPLLVELSRFHPHLILLIQSNQREFQMLLNETTPTLPLAAASDVEPEAECTGARAAYIVPSGSSARGASGAGSSSNILDLRALHAERTERQRAIAAAAAVGGSLEAARRGEEREMAKRAAAGAKKAKRKTKKQSTDASKHEAGGDEEREDFDAVLAEFGGASIGAGGSSSKPSSTQQAHGALPWSRDREEVARRERLRGVLQQKIAAGESHKRAAPSKATNKNNGGRGGGVDGRGGGHMYRRGDGGRGGR